jgi:uncharacterized SAM-binding protein YcdF (DUF218 family)
MPRSVGVFRNVGWQVTPAPCDYLVGEIDWTVNTSLTQSFPLLDDAVHEWVGLATYYATGKTAELFPAP